MDARELRIGNWVLEKQNKLLGEIFNITRTTCRIFVDNELEDLKPSLEDIEPIPLTEEWLEMFGFKMDWHISHKDEYFCMFQEGDKYYYTADEHHWTSEPFKHVHQLQNLFYALTGKELELIEQCKTQ